MMEKFLLLTSVAGIVFLLFLSLYTEPRLTEIEKIDEKFLDKFVKVRGEITEIKETKKLIIFELSDENKNIRTIIHKKKNKLSIEKNMMVEVIGKVVEYKGMVEIEAKKIKIL